jgi:hypothetical protein
MPPKSAITGTDQNVHFYTRRFVHFFSYMFYELIVVSVAGVQPSNKWHTVPVIKSSFSSESVPI